MIRGSRACINQSRVLFIQTERKRDDSKWKSDLIDVSSRNMATPDREWAAAHLTPTLTRGLVELCRRRPADPVEVRVRECVRGEHTVSNEDQ